MAVIRVDGSHAGTPESAVLYALNLSGEVESEGGACVASDELELESLGSAQTSRPAWGWRLKRGSPRCVLQREKAFVIEPETGAARRARFSERWSFREGVVIQRSDGSFHVAIEKRDEGTRQLVDETVSTATGAFRVSP